MCEVKREACATNQRRPLGRDTLWNQDAVDDDGFILLRCPHCGELFKLTAEDIEFDETLDIYCPSCGLCANNFLTQNVIDLALAKTSNYAMDVIAQQLQAFAKKNSSSLVRFEFKANREREPEPPIRAAIEAPQILTCHDCGRKAKVSPAIVMSAYTCLTRVVFSDMHARGTILWNALIDEDEARDAVVSFREKSFP